jgi:hypothetical protein
LILHRKQGAVPLQQCRLEDAEGMQRITYRLDMEERKTIEDEYRYPVERREENMTVNLNG